MWRLKIAEGQGPYLYSTNNFVGRQIWEFDPDAGSPEERRAFQQAREQWSENRKKGFHGSADLFMRMQLNKENGVDLASIPPVRVGEKEEITYEKVSIAVKKALRAIRAIQASDGHWPAEFAGPMFFIPPLIIVLYISGAINTILSSEHKKEMIRYIFNHQVLGVYDWDGCNPLPPEFWLFPSFLPYHPAKMWCYSRTTYMAMSYLYGRKYHGPLTDLVLSLRQEIHIEQYDQINWNKSRHHCCKDDLYYPHIRTRLFMGYSQLLHRAINEALATE